MRQIVLDTETTGLEFAQGHRIIEIGCVELVDRRLSGHTLHYYINPQRGIDEAASEVHGMTKEQLADKPLFADLAADIFEFIRDAELVIHNAPFDVGFLNYEFKQAGLGERVVDQHCQVLDTLLLARQKHPGQKNDLDALCARYNVDNTQRNLHGALLDAEILTDVYLAMTGGQTTLISQPNDFAQPAAATVHSLPQQKLTTPLITASAAELAEHAKWLALLDQQAEKPVVWRQLSG